MSVLYLPIHVNTTIINNVSGRFKVKLNQSYTDEPYKPKWGADFEIRLSIKYALAIFWIRHFMGKHCRTYV